MAFGRFCVGWWLLSGKVFLVPVDDLSWVTNLISETWAHAFPHLTVQSIVTQSDSCRNVWCNLIKRFGLVFCKRTYVDILKTKVTDLEANIQLLF